MAILAVTAAAVALATTPPAGAVTATAGLAPLTACRGQRLTNAPAVETRALRCLVNWTRVHAGLTRLQPNAELARSAAMRAGDIRRCNDFSHTPCGQAFITVFTVVGYFTGLGSVGENLAWGQGRLASPRVTMATWLRSPEHRQILLTADWRDFGVALAKAPALFGRSNVTVWVAQFGHHPLGLPLPG